MVSLSWVLHPGFSATSGLKVAIKNESKVSLAYEIRVYEEDGEVLDLATEQDPFDLVVGHQDVFPAIEEAIMGREEGDSFEELVAPERAFGPHDPKLVRTFPLEAFGEDAELVVGDAYTCETEDGLPLSFRVVSKKGRDIEIDLNHPLAGRTLLVKVSILRVS